MTNKEENRIIVITGPTAVGKSGTSIRVAKALRTEIVSADSMQVYRGMNVGTAKITKEEMDGVTHHLIDIRDPGEDYNVTAFQEEARKAISDIQSRGMIPVICGGTGFYIEALLYDIDFTVEEDDDSIRKELQAFSDENGCEALHEVLKEVDPESAEKIPPQNIRRVIRAIEFYRIHGAKISDHNEEESLKRGNPVYDAKVFVLTDRREALFDRINRRVDEMVSEGLLKEAEEILRKGLPRTSNAMQAIGYRELWPYFDGKVTLDDAIEKIKTDTRRYAKKQETWWKRNDNAIWIDISKGEAFHEIMGHLWADGPQS